MRFLRRLFLFFLLLTIAHQAIAQNLLFGGTLNYAQSKNTSTIPFTDFKATFTSSANAGIFLEKKIGSKSSLGLEALWVQIEAKQNRKNIFWTGPSIGIGAPAGFSNDEYRDHFSYIGLPVYCKFHLQKLGIKVGFQPMLFLFGSSNFSANGELNGQSFADSSETKDIKLNHDYGPKVGIDYTLWKGFNLRLDYYHGLKNIYPESAPSFFEGKNRQVNLGIQFILQPKKETKPGD